MRRLFRGETMPGIHPTYPDYPTIIHALARAAELGPNRPGIACEARELTYGQYAQVVGAMARRLQKTGVSDKNVGVMLTNSMEGVVALLGAMAAGKNQSVQKNAISMPQPAIRPSSATPEKSVGTNAKNPAAVASTTMFIGSNTTPANRNTAIATAATHGSCRCSPSRRAIRATDPQSARPV